MRENYRINDKCYFSGSGFDKNHEVGECSLAFEVIPKVKSVLEIGGGTGKVSHIINTLLADKTQHIVIEPGVGGNGNHGDEHLWKNREAFGDQYTIVKKYVNELTKEDLKVLKTDVECLYVDCEGCLLSFLKDTELGKNMLKQVKYVVNEMDGFTNNATHDPDLIKLLADNDFVIDLVGYGCGISCKTNVWKKIVTIEPFVTKNETNAKTKVKNNKKWLNYFGIVLLLLVILFILYYLFKQSKL